MFPSDHLFHLVTNRGSMWTVQSNSGLLARCSHVNAICAPLVPFLAYPLKTLGKSDEHPCMAFPPAFMPTHFCKKVHNFVRRLFGTTSHVGRFSLTPLWLCLVETNLVLLELLHDQLLLLFECKSDIHDSTNWLDLASRRVIVECSTLVPQSPSSHPFSCPSHTDKNGCGLQWFEDLPKLICLLLPCCFKSTSSNLPSQSSPAKR